MPLPIIIGVGIGVGTAVTGIYNLVTGKGKLNKAKEIVENAKRRYERKLSKINREKEQTNSFAQEYANQIVEIRSTSYEKVINVLENIGQKNKKKYLSLLHELKISVADVDDYKSQFIQAKEIATFSLSAVSGGIAASQAALSAVGLFGVASTGTAISSLSGAAASNAILAWLGGGSLAAGGGGIAMGSVVLGGITVGPALLISGLIVSSKAEKALTEAARYKAEYEVEIKKIELATTALSQISTRIKELSGIILKLSESLSSVLKKIDVSSFDENDSNDMSNLKKSLLIIKSISEIASTRVIDSSGNVSQLSGTIVAKYKNIE